MRKIIYANLRNRMIIFTLTVSLAPLILLGAAIYYQFAKVAEVRIKDQITHLARSQSQAVEVFLKERTTILSMLVDSHSFEELSQQENLSRLFKEINRRSDNLGLVDLGVIDSAGQHLAYSGPFNLRGLNYFQQPWFSQTMSRGQFISDVYMGFRQLPHFIIAVRGHDGDQSWILRATIDSEVFNRLVRTAQAGSSGDAYIINKEGIYQTQPRFQGEILGKSGLDTRPFGSGATVIEKKNETGQTQYYSGAWLKNNDWLLVIRQDTPYEMSGLAQTRNMEIVIIALGCLAIVVATLLISHMAVNHLETADQQMNQLNAQLVQSDKLAALGKMAAGIAHEINNPLAVIGEKAGWMKDLLDEEEFQGSDNLREYAAALAKIEEHVDRARKITHNMLGFARRMEPHLDDVDVNNVLDQTIELLANHARINNIRIEKQYGPDLPVIASDQSQLQQVFMNLINNAIDAIGQDGVIKVQSVLENPHILIRICDDGPGITKEQLRRIFDPFFTTKAAGQGTGLGLSISYSIIEKMGGTIQADSEPGQGATFTIRLPIVVPDKK
jgi:two-component system NtrC family sensor kinase